MNDNSVLYLVGGGLLLYFLSQREANSPAAINAAQQTAALQAQQISANQQNQNIQTGAGLVNSLVNDFTG
jgi:hypothetical protein